MPWAKASATASLRVAARAGQVCQVELLLVGTIDDITNIIRWMQAYAPRSHWQRRWNVTHVTKTNIGDRIRGTHNYPRLFRCLDSVPPIILGQPALAREMGGIHHRRPL